MSKYDGLRGFLRSHPAGDIPATFAEIEQAIGTKLPPKAQHHRAWWSNNTSNNVMTRIWLDEGFETAQVDIAGRKLVFRRKAGSPGFAETEQSYSAPSAKKNRRSPLFGAMKGMLWVDPNWDLTKPALDEDELAEWEASLDRKAEMYQRGLGRKP